MKRMRTTAAAATLLAAGYAFIPSTNAFAAETSAVSNDVMPSGELFSPDGVITRVDLPANARRRTAATPAEPAAVTATVTPVEVNGPSDNRIDIVFVGDGYTEAELDTYGTNVSHAWAVLADREPFKTYRELFNVWRVGVISPVSGVSGDPAPDVVKDTPLSLTYWCDGLERLVCGDIDQIKAYAALAPGADQIAAIANSPKYGGAGYTDEEVVTFSGGHASGPEIFPHELVTPSATWVTSTGGPDRTRPGFADVS